MSKFQTARGSVVDMASLVAKNEQTRAVGNMNVNARGDIIDHQGRIVQDNNRRVNKVYQKTVTDVPENVTKQLTQAKEMEQNKPQETEMTEFEREFEQLDEDIVKEPPPIETNDQKS